MSERIRRLASFVRSGSVVYDLCCDHGYIGWEVWEQKAPAALYFVDQSENALRQVRRHLEERGFEQDPRIKVIAQPAEQITIDPRPSDFIMAGVGLKTMDIILRQLFAHGLGSHRLILSPEKNSQPLRRLLRAQGFGLIAEDVVMDRGRFKEIIVVEAKGGPFHLMGEGFMGREDPTAKNFVTMLREWHGAQDRKKASPVRTVPKSVCTTL